MVQEDALKKDLHGCVSLELRQHLDYVQEHEEDELGGVDQVPEVLEVIESLFFQLDQFEEDEEDLGEEAHCVGHVEQHQVVCGKRQDKWNHESKDVESKHALQECLCLNELEVHQLSDGFQVVEGDV